MKTYSEWCRHYNYDPAEQRSKNDYECYVENLDLFTRISNGEADDQIEKKEIDQ